MQGRVEPLRAGRGERLAGGRLDNRFIPLARVPSRTFGGLVRRARAREWHRLARLRATSPECPLRAREACLGQ